MPSGQEQRGAGPHVGRDQMGRAQAELRDEPAQEIRRGAWGQHVGSALRMAEAGQVDRDQPPYRRQRWPDAPEGEQALRPRAGEQDDRAVRAPGVRVPDLQLIDEHGIRWHG